jgi:hypothetical protein
VNYFLGFVAVLALTLIFASLVNVGGDHKPWVWNTVRLASGAALIGVLVYATWRR